MSKRRSTLRFLSRRASSPTPTPIARLSDDTLYLVFVVVAAVEPIRGIHDISQSIAGEKQPTYSECLAWMRLSAVCRHWRAVLLASAPLWADVVFFLPPEQATMALARSAGASIDMHIPLVKKTALAISHGEIKSSKSWGQPHIHRERLLALAVAHATRMSHFAAADLTSQNYRDIFIHGKFNYLRSLVLAHNYRDPGSTPPPTREELGHLCICAPHVHTARLSVSLPVTHSKGPGLILRLHGLRYLYVDAAHDRQLVNPARLRWITDLVRRAPGLQHLKLDLPVAGLVKWNELLGHKSIHLPALRSVDLGGPVAANMDKLFSRLSKVVLPWMCFRSLQDMKRDEGLHYLRVYGEIIGHALSSYPLDSAHISIREWWVPDAATTFTFWTFSSDDMSKCCSSVDDLLDNIRRHARHSAGLEARLRGHVMHREVLEELAPLLTQQNIRDLYLDYMSETWTRGECVRGMRQFMQSRLNGVTILRCIESRRETYSVACLTIPCTASLRAIIPEDRRDGKTQPQPSTSLDLEPSDSGPNHRAHPDSSPMQCMPHNASQFLDPEIILPRLHTIVAAMRVANYKEKDLSGELIEPRFGTPSSKVSEWWVELLKALKYRRDIGLPIRTLRIIGGWTTRKLRSKTAKLDRRMLRRALELVSELFDERTVDMGLEIAPNHLAIER